MTTELLSDDPTWSFRSAKFFSQSKHVPSEAVQSKDVLLVITYQQYRASGLLEEFEGSRVYG